jgi:hypothetical protein
MILVMIEVETAVHTGSLVVVIIALTLALVTILAGGADYAAPATIEVVVLQVDAGLTAGVGVANALSCFTDFLRTTRLIAAAAVRCIALRIDAGLIASQQVSAPGHAFPLGTKLVTGRATAATVLRVGVRIDASVPASGLALLAHEGTLARHAGSLARARSVARATVLLGVIGVDAKIVADYVWRRTFGVAAPVDTELVAQARGPASPTVVEARVRVDTAPIAHQLGAQAVDHAYAVFADLVIQARLAAAATVHHVAVNADTLPVTLGL